MSEGETHVPSLMNRREEDLVAIREEQAKAGYREECKNELSDIIEEIEIEDLTVDGICGVY
jgi:mycofactocin precursor